MEQAKQLADKIDEILDGADGDVAVAALTTVLKAVLELAPTEEDRLIVIEDLVNFLKEPDYAAQ